MSTIKSYNSFLNENKSELSDKQLYRNKFIYHGQRYRLNSWYYIYVFKNGGRKIVPVNKEDANAVGGTSVGGVVAKIKDIEWVKDITPFDDDFIKEREKYHKLYVDEEHNIMLFKFLKALPPNLTRDEYEEIVIDNIMKDMDTEKED